MRKAQWQWRAGKVNTPIQMADPQGPPDLDEIFRKFNQSLKRNLRGGKNGNQNNSNNSGGGGNLPSNAMGGAFALAAGIGVSVWLATGFTSSSKGSKERRIAPGQIHANHREAGPRWHWPLSGRDGEKVDIQRVRAIEIGHRNSQKTKMREEGRSC